MPQDGKISEGPHSATGWVNMIGVPAIVVPGGFYPSGPPFGIGNLSAAVEWMGIYWVGRMRMSRQLIIGSLRCWWNRGCCCQTRDEAIATSRIHQTGLQTRHRDRLSLAEL